MDSISCKYNNNALNCVKPRVLNKTSNTKLNHTSFTMSPIDTKCHIVYTSIQFICNIITNKRY